MLCCPVYASTDQDFSDEFNWNLTIELGLVKDSTLIVGGEQDDFDDFAALSVWIDLYYKGFFIQSNRYRSSGVIGATEIGYELHLDKDFEINIINKNYLAGFDQRNVGLISDQEIAELSGIDTRKFAPNQGIRYLRYLDNAVAWVDVSVDLLTGYHRGWVVDAFYNRTMEYRNWDVSYGIGASLFSEDMTDYFFGVDSHEIRENRPFYEPGSGYRVELEAVAHYPIAEDWLFTIGSTFSHYSNSIYDSPLVARQNVLRFKMSVSYVF
ncbi:MAG: hypothetical protein Alis3KO_29460 [Aliiglaciecola sp.]